MIESHGGEIGVSSQPGQGATFAFYIAAHTIESQATVIKPDELALRPKKASVSTPQHLYSILVVEDNLINQKVLRNQLQKLGHTVHVASHGAEALSFLSTTCLWAANSASSSIDVSVILMDIEMPVMGGIECTRRIRKAQADGELNRHVPIIAVSANARDVQVSEALECGMDNAIAKPFRVADLMPKIEALVA
jgi:CheY-like chemotaxis protein